MSENERQRPEPEGLATGPQGRAPNTHRLKTHMLPFHAVWKGEKTFEVRINDRDYRSGDTVMLIEFNEVTGEEIGRRIDATVTYLVPGGSWGLPPDLCVFGIKVTDKFGVPMTPEELEILDRRIETLRYAERIELGVRGVVGATLYLGAAFKLLLGLWARKLVRDIQAKYPAAES